MNEEEEEWRRKDESDFEEDPLRTEHHGEGLLTTTRREEEEEEEEEEIGEVTEFIDKNRLMEEELELRLKKKRKRKEEELRNQRKEKEMMMKKKKKRRKRKVWFCFGGESKNKNKKKEEEEEKRKKKRQEFGLLHPKSTFHTYLLMFLISFVSTGSYFAYDSTSPLEDQIEKEFDISSFEFNLLYVVYSMPNTIMPFLGGFFLDRVGTSVGVVVLGCFVLLGTLMVSLGAYLHTYPLMVCGRFVFGIGSESLVVAQTCMLSEWFRDKLLATGVGVGETVSHLGTAGAFIVVPLLIQFSKFYDALFFATFLCMLSFWSGLGYVYLSQRAKEILGIGDEEEGEREGEELGERRTDGSSSFNGPDMLSSEEEDEEDEVVSSSSLLSSPSSRLGLLTELPPDDKTLWSQLKSVRNFPSSFWMACLTSTLFYGGIFPFDVVATDFFENKYGFSKSAAGLLTSVITLSPVVVSSVTGKWVDTLGRRLSFVVLGCCCLVPAFGILAFSDANPLLAMVLMGVGYSICPVALYPIIADVVGEEQDGVAFGLEASFLNITYMVVNLLVGVLTKDSTGETYPYIYLFFGLSCGALVCSLLWMIHDQWFGMGVNKANPNRKWRLTPHLRLFLSVRGVTKLLPSGSYVSSLITRQHQGIINLEDSSDSNLEDTMMTSFSDPLTSSFEDPEMAGAFRMEDMSTTSVQRSRSTLW